MIPNSPTVSVLVPVYNGEKFLGPTIESLISQSFKDFEIIIVNDGSTDKSGEIADSFAKADDRIIVMHQDNSGVSGALNNGARIARGNLIARLDADDIADPQRLEMQVRFMNDNPAIVCCGSAIRYIDEDGRELRCRVFPLSNEDIQRLILSKGCYAHSAVIYRRDVFEQVGGYRSNFNSAEDLDLFLRLSEKGHMANLPDFLCSYRLHASQVTHCPTSRHRLQAFLAVTSALERRKGQQETKPDATNLSELAILKIEQWLSDDEMPWSSHIVSAIYALNGLMPGSKYMRLSLNVAMKLLRTAQPVEALSTIFAVVRARVGLA